MGIAGALFWLLGLLLVGLSLDSSKPAFIDSESFVALQQQAFYLYGGLAAMLMGTVFVVGSCIVGAIEQASNRQAAIASPEFAAELEEKQAEARTRMWIIGGVVVAIAMGIVILISLKY